MSESERLIDIVAAELAWLDPEPVFVGGAIIGLFLDALGRSQLRATLDVDCIERYRDAALGQLPRGGDSSAQERRILALLRRLAGGS